MLESRIPFFTSPPRLMDPYTTTPPPPQTPQTPHLTDQIQITTFYKSGIEISAQTQGNKQSDAGWPDHFPWLHLNAVLF